MKNKPILKSAKFWYPDLSGATHLPSLWREVFLVVISSMVFDTFLYTSEKTSATRPFNVQTKRQTQIAELAFFLTCHQNRNNKLEAIWTFFLLKYILVKFVFMTKPFLVLCLPIFERLEKCSPQTNQKYELTKDPKSWGNSYVGIVTSVKHRN